MLVVFLMVAITFSALSSGIATEPVVGHTLSLNNLSPRNSPHPHSQLRRSAPTYGTQCTEEQLQTIEKANVTMRRTNCPQRDFWIQVLLKDSLTQSTINIVSVGCNKGDDFIALMEAYSGNELYNVSLWLDHLHSQLHQNQFVCGRTHRIPTPVHIVRPIHGYCIEPMPQNLALLKNLTTLMKFDPKAVHIDSIAISSLPGKGYIPDADAGTEHLGLTSPLENNTATVNITNLDSYFFENQISIIDFLSIDTEGHDGLVLIGMAQSLAMKMIRVFEFEYHNKGPWATMDLSLIISMIDIHGYDCWWQGNQGELWRLTGCWLDSHGTKRDWSNVVCVNRQEVTIHSAMVSHSKQFMSPAGLS